ncbi:MAG: hypothetical protein Q7P63_02850 [Verrucomicrobiota bacterium JB022]|nr:hypothetical protein [Verrucomicrobiota bacterium JB022]
MKPHRLFLACLALLSLSSVLQAAPQPEVDPATGALISVETLRADDGFVRDYTPLRIVVSNQSDREINFTPQVHIWDYGSESLTFNGPKTPVAAQSTRTIEMAISSRERNYATLNEVYGFSINDPGTRNVLWSEAADRLIGAAREGELPQMDMRVLPQRLPHRFDGLLGLKALALSANDWNGLDAEQQTAIRDWVRLGGHFIVADGAETGWTPDFWTGFGQVDVIPGENMIALSARLDGTRTLPLALERIDEHAFGMGKSLEIQDMLQPARPPYGVLGGVVLLFAVIAGPGALFALARPPRQHRLFLIVPAVSVAAVVLILGISLAAEGLGSSGVAQRIHYLDAQQQRVMVTQAAEVRSRLLTNDRFSLPAEATLIHLPPDSEVFNYDQFQQERIEVTPSSASGILKSRALTSHRIVGSYPTQMKLQLVEGATPELVSLLPAKLDQVWLKDARGRFWKTTNLRLSERRALEPADADEVPLSLKSMPVGTPVYLAVGEMERPLFEPAKEIDWLAIEDVFYGTPEVLRP